MGVRINSIKYPRPNNAMQHSELYPLLGIKPGNHLPDEGLPPRLVQGVEVYALPKVKGFRLRVMAICTCGKHLSFGRLTQHKCK